jgi:hypothetical protein
MLKSFGKIPYLPNGTNSQVAVALSHDCEIGLAQSVNPCITSGSITIGASSPAAPMGELSISTAA